MALAARTPEPQNHLRLVPGGAEEREPDSGPALSGRVRAFDVASRRAQAEVDESELIAGFESGVGLRAPDGGAAADEAFDRESLPETRTHGADLSEREDGELVALARAGQPAAFEALYRRHSGYVLALAVRVQGNATDVEDIVHDSFLKVHDRLDDLRAGASFRAWLAQVVVSLVRTRLRRRRMLGALGLSTAEPIDLDALVSPQAGPEVRAQLAQVYGVLREATVDQSICWTLRYVDGRKLEDVAEISGCSLATAKRRIAAVQDRILLLETYREPSVGDEESWS